MNTSQVRQPATIPKSDLEILSQLIDEELGQYRVRADKRVFYLDIEGNTFNIDTMCRPYLLIPALPDLEDKPWTRIYIFREGNELQIEGSYDRLPAVEDTFSPHRVDILSLRRTRKLGQNVSEVDWQGRTVIAKIVSFPWEMPRMRRETAAYATIVNQDPGLAPAVLAHITENGRVIGLLLEKVEGDFASIEDLARCEEVLGRLHAMGLVHGDVNRYNFLVAKDKTVRLLDFEHTKALTEDSKIEELQSLPKELTEETGRGGPPIVLK